MSEALLGITPVLKRWAFHYLCKGFGSHAVEPPYNVFFDEVRVVELYPWEAVGKLEPRGGVIVEFWYVGHRLKWVEFGVSVIGCGGDPILREVL